MHPTLIESSLTNVFSRNKASSSLLKIRSTVKRGYVLPEKYVISPRFLCKTEKLKKGNYNVSTHFDDLGMSPIQDIPEEQLNSFFEFPIGVKSVAQCSKAKKSKLKKNFRKKTLAGSRRHQLLSKRRKIVKKLIKKKEKKVVVQAQFQLPLNITLDDTRNFKTKIPPHEDWSGYVLQTELPAEVIPTESKQSLSTKEIIAIADIKKGQNRAAVVLYKDPCFKSDIPCETVTEWKEACLKRDKENERKQMKDWPKEHGTVPIKRRAQKRAGEAFQVDIANSKTVYDSDPMPIANKMNNDLCSLEDLQTCKECVDDIVQLLVCQEIIPHLITPLILPKLDYVHPRSEKVFYKELHDILELREKRNTINGKHWSLFALFLSRGSFLTVPLKKFLHMAERKEPLTRENLFGRVEQNSEMDYEEFRVFIARNMNENGEIPTRQVVSVPAPKLFPRQPSSVELPENQLRPTLTFHTFSKKNETHTQTIPRAHAEKSSLANAKAALYCLDQLDQMELCPDQRNDERNRILARADQKLVQKLIDDREKEKKRKRMISNVSYKPGILEQRALREEWKDDDGAGPSTSKNLERIEDVESDMTPAKDNNMHEVVISQILMEKDPASEDHLSEVSTAPNDEMASSVHERSLTPLRQNWNDGKDCGPSTTDAEYDAVTNSNPEEQRSTSGGNINSDPTREGAPSDGSNRSTPDDDDRTSPVEQRSPVPVEFQVKLEEPDEEDEEECDYDDVEVVFVNLAKDRPENIEANSMLSTDHIVRASIHKSAYDPYIEPFQAVARPEASPEASPGAIPEATPQVEEMSPELEEVDEDVEEAEEGAGQEEVYPEEEQDNWKEEVPKVDEINPEMEGDENDGEVEMIHSTLEDGDVGVEEAYQEDEYQEGEEVVPQEEYPEVGDGNAEMEQVHSNWEHGDFEVEEAYQGEVYEEQEQVFPQEEYSEVDRVAFEAMFPRPEKEEEDPERKKKIELYEGDNRPSWWCELSLYYLENYYKAEDYQLDLKNIASMPHEIYFELHPDATVDDYRRDCCFEDTPVVDSGLVKRLIESYLTRPPEIDAMRERWNSYEISYDEHHRVLFEEPYMKIKVRGGVLTAEKVDLPLKIGQQVEREDEEDLLYRMSEDALLTGYGDDVPVTYDEDYLLSNDHAMEFDNGSPRETAYDFKNNDFDPTPYAMSPMQSPEPITSLNPSPDPVFQEASSPIHMSPAPEELIDYQGASPLSPSHDSVFHRAPSASSSILLKSPTPIELDDQEASPVRLSPDPVFQEASSPIHMSPTPEEPEHQEASALSPSPEVVFQKAPSASSSIVLDDQGGSPVSLSPDPVIHEDPPVSTPIPISPAPEESIHQETSPPPTSEVPAATEQSTPSTIPAASSTAATESTAGSRRRKPKSVKKKNVNSEMALIEKEWGTGNRSSGGESVAGSVSKSASEESTESIVAPQTTANVTQPTTESVEKTLQEVVEEATKQRIEEHSPSVEVIPAVSAEDELLLLGQPTDEVVEPVVEPETVEDHLIEETAVKEADLAVNEEELLADIPVQPVMDVATNLDLLKEMEVIATTEVILNVPIATPTVVPAEPETEETPEPADEPATKRLTRSAIAEARRKTLQAPAKPSVSKSKKVETPAAEPPAKKAKLVVEEEEEEEQETAITKRVLRSAKQPSPPRKRKGKKPAAKTPKTPGERIQPRRGVKKVDVAAEEPVKVLDVQNVDDLVADIPEPVETVLDNSEHVTPTEERVAYIPVTEDDLLAGPVGTDHVDPEEEQFTVEQLLGEVEEPQHIEPVVERETEGSPVSRRLRRSGKVPASETKAGPSKTPKKKKEESVSIVEQESAPETEEGEEEPEDTDTPTKRTLRKRALNEVLVHNSLPKPKNKREKRLYLSKNNPAPRIGGVRLEKAVQPVRLTGVATSINLEPESPESSPERLILMRDIPVIEPSPDEAVGQQAQDAGAVLQPVKEEIPDDQYEIPPPINNKSRKSKKRQRAEILERDIKQEDGVGNVQDEECQVVMTKIAIKQEVDDEMDDCMVVQANYQVDRQPVDAEPEVSLPKSTIPDGCAPTQSQFLLKRINEGINEHFMSDPELFCSLMLILKNDTETMGRVFKSPATITNRTSQFTAEFLQYLTSSPRHLNEEQARLEKCNVAFSTAFRNKTSVLLSSAKLLPMHYADIVKIIKDMKTQIRSDCPRGMIEDNERDATAATADILLGQYIDSVMKMAGLSNLTWIEKGHARRRLEILYYGWRQFINSGGFLKVLLALNREDVKPISAKFRKYCMEYLQEIESHYAKAIEQFHTTDEQMIAKICAKVGVTAEELAMIDADARHEELPTHKNKCIQCGVMDMKVWFSTADMLEIHEKLHSDMDECPRCYEDVTEAEMIMHRVNKHATLRLDDD